MPVTYMHENGSPVLETSSDVELDLPNKQVTFWIKPANGGNAVPTAHILVGATSPYLFAQVPVSGCLTVGEDKAVSGRIVRATGLIGEDDTGTFSGTHNM